MIIARIVLADGNWKRRPAPARLRRSLGRRARRITLNPCEDGVLLDATIHFSPQDSDYVRDDLFEWALTFEPEYESMVEVEVEVV